jgi:hypothetical protein
MRITKCDHAITQKKRIKERTRCFVGNYFDIKARFDAGEAAHKYYPIRIEV